MAKAATTVADDSLWPPATADQLGRLLGISGRRCRELASEGVFPRASGGRYPVEACVQAYVASLRTAAKAKPATDPKVAAAGLDGRQQRARLARLQADRVELELQRERGELVEVRPLQIKLVTMITGVRNKIMSVPPMARGRLPHLTIDDIEILEDELRQALEQLAADPRIFGPGVSADDLAGDDDEESDE